MDCRKPARTVKVACDGQTGWSDELRLRAMDAASATDATIESIDPAGARAQSDSIFETLATSAQRFRSPWVISPSCAGAM